MKLDMAIFVEPPNGADSSQHALEEFFRAQLILCTWRIDHWPRTDNSNFVSDCKFAASRWLGFPLHRLLCVFEPHSTTNLPFESKTTYNRRQPSGPGAEQYCRNFIDRAILLLIDYLGRKVRLQLTAFNNSLRMNTYERKQA
jgi:hypothetical protein